MLIVPHSSKRYGVKNPQSLEGVIFEPKGQAASYYQFYLSDKEEHFVRAAFYFNSKVRPDSLAPIFNFLRSGFRKDGRNL